MKAGDYFKELKSALEEIYDPLEAASLSRLVFQEVAGIYPVDLGLFPEKELNTLVLEKMKSVRDRLLTNEPLQYILGYAWFEGMKFFVNSDVLIPRQETEELIESASGFLRSMGKATFNILEIGTGSGCISISLKKRFPGADILATDFSTGALEVAAMNSKNLGYPVEFIKHDILNDDVSLLKGRYDLIISNPPYICKGEKSKMHANVLDFEPHAALFVPDEDSLLFYNKMLISLKNLLLPEGAFIFEINEELGRDIMELASSLNYFKNSLIQDLSGKDRIFLCKP